MGRITHDLELRTTPNGISVVSFAIATDRNYKENGDYPTDFFEVVAWRKSAEFICNYFGKGQLIAISGTLQTRKFTDKQNIERKVTEILVDGAHFCGGKKQENGGNSVPNGNHGQANNNGGNYGQQSGNHYMPQDDEFPNVPHDFQPDFRT